MLKVVLDVAPQQGFTFSPVMIVGVVAAVAIVVTVFLLRFLRKGNK